ncbi:MAG: hypothetical protein M1834_002134 [Cirrosporium novae-zelandiae]|nr:MAG: hypothetical protein M1834_002134 [Cirrosporium novae-zelandiae]
MRIDMAPSLNNQPQELTAEALVDLMVPTDVRLSPSGNQAVYTLSPFTRSGKHDISSIWIAEVGKEHSARQLTSGLFNDRHARWSPTGESIAFLSDRAEAGESCAIYILPISGGGEAYAITTPSNKKQISSVVWSPNGKFIAFTSPDEKTAEQEAKEKQKDDAQVYGEHWEFNRLRCLHVPTRQLSTLISKTAHVASFTWSEDSTEIAYILHQTPDINSSIESGVRFERISIASSMGEGSNQNELLVCEFPGPAAKLIWCGTNLSFLAGAAPGKSNTSYMVYGISTNDSTWYRDAHGMKDCATDLRLTCGCVAVLVQSGLRDQLHLLKDSILYDGLHEIATWDVNLARNDQPVIVLSKSSSSCPDEIYSISNGKMVQLSQHGLSISALNLSTSQPIYCKSSDGTSLDGILHLPAKSPYTKPYPTIVLIHGGPYFRSTFCFNLPIYAWSPYLLSAGYAILAPNYRGGSSHGEKFASAARGAMGTKDYDDIIATLTEGIERGLIDGTKVAIGGWSQGGFLSYLSVTRPTSFHFKAAVCGAGVTEWDMMVMTSDFYLFEAELAGNTPWGADSKSGKKSRHGSAIWHMKPSKNNNNNNKTPILILHGEDDVRVPLSQATAFHRGCLHHGIPCEMVTYPREGHHVVERLHILDMLRRVRRFYDFHLG